MGAADMTKYRTAVDLEQTGTSHALIVDLVGQNVSVLDVGCATGYLAEVLKARGCRVWGFEMDADAAAEAEQHLERVVVGDLDRVDLTEAFAGETFDVVVFGDVLEHLRDPLPSLRQAKALLAPGGSVVVSVPNVAHGSVRLSLLRGEFRYGPLGLLDDTHLRFFTRDGLEELMAAAGLVMVDTRRSVAGFFDTELQVRPEDHDPAVVERLLEDLDATTYQFVVRAVPHDGDQAVRDMYARGRLQMERIHELEVALTRMTAERDVAQAAAGAVVDHTPELDELRRRAEHAERELEALRQTITVRSMKLPRALYGKLRSRD